MKIPLLVKITATICLTISTVFASTPAHAADPAQPWPGPKADWVFVEAETFDAPETAWSVKDTPYHSRAIIASNMKYLGADNSKPEPATKTIDIPSDGYYKLWVNFRQPVLKQGGFEIAVSQNGKELLRQKFDNAKQDSGEGDIAGNAGNESKRTQFDWAAALSNLPLIKGQATISVFKSASPAGKGLATGQMVDCFLLTLDHEYKPDYRDFVPQTYIRLKLKEADIPLVYFYGFVNHRRPDWYTNIAIGKNILREAVTVPKGDLMKPGDQTEWLNFTRQLYIDSDTNLLLQTNFGYHKPDTSHSSFQIDIASQPDDKSIVASFQRSGPGAGMAVRFPPDLTDGKKPILDTDVAKANLEMVRSIPQPTFGKRPTKFPTFISMNASDLKNSTGVYDDEIKVLELLGFSGRKSSEITDNDRKHGLKFGRSHARVMLFGPGGFNEPQWEKIKGFISREGAAAKADPHNINLTGVQLTDESGPPDLEAIAGVPIHEKAFIDWLKETGQTPESLGVKTWSQVKLTPDRLSPTPALYVASQKYRAWMIVNFFKECTLLIREAFPGHMPSHQNFSDGAVYQANMYAQGNDYFTWYRNQGLDLAWSEDWTNIGSTPQLAGWNVALLRAATRKHNQPIGMYVIASGRSPVDVKLKAYSNLAQGAKILELFSYTPTYTGHETSWYMHPGTYKAVMELNREIGAAEEILIDAMPARAETAILYSRIYDIWNVGFDNAAGHDRMHTYLALRHANVAVDVIDEEDVIAGDLVGRKHLYLSGEQIESKLVPVLAEWVKNGGTLVLSAGAGTRDELNQPTDALDKALGLTRGTFTRHQPYWHASAYRVMKFLKKQGEVNSLEPMKYVGPPFVPTPWFAQSQVLYPTPRSNSLSGGRLATFAANKDETAQTRENSLAKVVQYIEKGKVESFGFLPGLSYIIQAHEAFEENGQKTGPTNATLKRHVNPEGFTQLRYSNAPDVNSFGRETRKLIVGEAPKTIIQPVTVNPALVEATFMQGAKGWVIPLANYTGSPITSAKITINVPADKPFGEIHSSRQGKLTTTPGKEAGSVVVEIPLDSTDMIFAQWK